MLQSSPSAGYPGVRPERVPGGGTTRRDFATRNHRLIPLRHVLTDALTSLDPAKPVFGGFSAARDVVLSIAGDGFLKFQEAVGFVPPAAPGPAAAKGVIASPADIVDCFAACVASGHGTDVPLASPEVGAPLAEYFPHKNMVGGTGVQVANCLAHCGFTHITAHVPFLAPAMREILHPAIRLIGNNRHYESAGQSGRAGRGFAGVHYILDYAAGAAVRTDRGVLRAARPDRIILGGNPYNARLRIAQEYRDLFAEPRPDSALIAAGFAAPRDLAAFREFAGDFLDLLKRYRANTPRDGFVHLEECHHAREPRERRSLIRREVWPRIDSLGMNEAEFAVLADFLGLDAGDVWGSLLAVADGHGLRRVCLHTAESSRTVSLLPFEAECRAGGMGILFASARAHYGRFAGREEIGSLLGRAESFLAGREVPEPRDLAGGYRAIEIPTLKGLPVVSSIGLGDAFTAGVAAYL